MSLFDIPVISRLQQRGVQLDRKRALTRPESPLAVALRAPLTLNMPASYTYIARTDAPGVVHAGFVQLRCRPSDRAEADVTYIAPALSGDPALIQLWTRLLDAVCWEAGRWGVQRIYASLPASTEEAIPFLNAGFMIFAKEELLGCAPVSPSTASPRVSLRPLQKGDVWALQRLYAAVVPLGVKQVEGLYEPGTTYAQTSVGSLIDRREKEAYVLEKDGEVIAHVEVYRGRIGHWIHFMLHPDASELAGELIEAGLALFGKDEMLPVYTHVRTYENHLRPALQAKGFQVLEQRELAVRQAVARVQVPALISVRGLEPRPEISARPTFIHTQSFSEPIGCLDGGTRHVWRN